LIPNNGTFTIRFLPFEYPSPVHRFYVASPPSTEESILDNEKVLLSNNFTLLQSHCTPSTDYCVMTGSNSPYCPVRHRRARIDEARQSGIIGSQAFVGLILLYVMGTWVFRCYDRRPRRRKGSSGSSGRYWTGYGWRKEEADCVNCRVGNLVHHTNDPSLERTGIEYCQLYNINAYKDKDKCSSSPEMQG
jgi:hypothetical protein